MASTSTCRQPFQEGAQQHPPELQHGGCALPPVYGGVAPLWQASSSAVSPLPPAAPPPERSSSSLSEARALKNHSEAERRRRERINAHLATMRRIIPDTKQMDKATLLATVVNQLKDLKSRKAFQSQQGTPQPMPVIPAEANGVTVDCYYTSGATTTTGADERPVMFVQASISCDDRPGLLADVATAVHGLRLRAVRADMASLGGRTRCSFLLCKEDGGDGTSLLVSQGGNVKKKALELEEDVRQALARAAFAEVARHGARSSKKGRGIWSQSFCTRL